MILYSIISATNGDDNVQLQAEAEQAGRQAANSCNIAAQPPLIHPFSTLPPSFPVNHAKEENQKESPPSENKSIPSMSLFLMMAHLDQERVI